MAINEQLESFFYTKISIPINEKRYKEDLEDALNKHFILKKTSRNSLRLA
jgi:hypothetical protein